MTLITNDSFNILIVDDNRNNLFTLKTLILEYIQAHIIEAESGIAALKILLKENVDLIILDVQMPEMDGFETAKAIRARKKTQHIPIVFLTAAYKTDEFRQKGFAVGAADYLTKPIDTVQLISKLQTYLRFIQQDRQHRLELEQKVMERTVELIKARQELEKRVEERTAELLIAKEEAEQARTMAETASLAKTQFLANMSHELRTPLNAILGYCEMLMEEVGDLGGTECMDDLVKIQSASHHLLGLISDILDISKIEAGKIDLVVEEFDLNEVIGDVVKIMQPLVEKRANLLFVKGPARLGKMCTDMGKLRQMLLNLLTNATKFTEKGSIYLEIVPQGEFIHFTVSDNGIGMTEEQQKGLFKPFMQADSSTTRRYGGTGLGLAITKEFVNMMAGEIKVQSEFGRGSTLTITLPMNLEKPIGSIPESELLTEPGLLEGDGIVLVIDDDPNVRQMLRKDLSDLGYAVAVAANGEDGLKLSLKLRPDAILLDVQMPEMEGWWVLSALKSNSLLCDIPVIMISMEEDKQRGYALGATDYLTKPVSHDKLVTVLEKYHLQDKSQSLIMLIEDENLLRRAVAAILEVEGWKVFQAEDGQVALEHLDDKKPDLILLDLNMPVMNGFEFLNCLQEHEKWQSIPVVVLTARHLTTEEQARLNSFAVPIFHKESYSKDELIQQVHHLISDSAVGKEECVQSFIF